MEKIFRSYSPMTPTSVSFSQGNSSSLAALIIIAEMDTSQETGNN